MIENVISHNSESSKYQSYILNVTKKNTKGDTLRLSLMEQGVYMRDSDIILCYRKGETQYKINGWTKIKGHTVLFSCNGISLHKIPNSKKNLILKLQNHLIIDGCSQIWNAYITANSLNWESYSDGYITRKYIDKETYDYNKDRINALLKKEREDYRKKHGSVPQAWESNTIDTYYVIIPKGW